MRMLKDPTLHQIRQQDSLCEYLLGQFKYAPEELQREIYGRDHSGKLPMHYVLASRNLHILRMMLSVNAQDTAYLREGCEPEDFSDKMYNKIHGNINKHLNNLQAVYDSLYTVLQQMTRLINKTEFCLMTSLNKASTEAVIVMGYAHPEKDRWMGQFSYNTDHPMESRDGGCAKEEEDYIIIPNTYREQATNTFWVDIPVKKLRNVFLDSMVQYIGRNILLQSFDSFKGMVIFFDSHLVMKDNLCEMKKIIVQAGAYCVEGFLHAEQCIFVISGNQEHQEKWLTSVEKLRKAYQHMPNGVSREEDAVLAILKILYTDISRPESIRKNKIFSHRETCAIQHTIVRLSAYQPKGDACQWHPEDVAGLLEHVKNITIYQKTIEKNIRSFYGDKMFAHLCDNNHGGAIKKIPLHCKAADASDGYSFMEQHLLQAYHKVHHKRHAVGALIESTLYHLFDTQRIAQKLHMPAKKNTIKYIFQNILQDIHNNFYFC